ncbi:protein ABHD11 isoform X3 [Dermacentor silvarum]|uniref:protein ABHD11 isoform X3 n=1 Tax=Dermacentor silvarum TaxID=543639 RepID=UPI002100F480|nr:protein ABHD11 isoform X3 [Dermacentor silvarum]
MGSAARSMAATRGLQLVRALSTTPRHLSSGSFAQSHATVVTSRRTSMGCRRHGAARYCSQPRTGAVRLSYTLHESDDVATASTLPPIVALEGLFGRRENLTAVSKALAAATGRNPSTVERLVVVDIAPIALPKFLVSQWLPWQINAMEHIASLLSPDMSLDQAFQLADEYLSRQVTKPYVRSFLLSNLRKGPRTYEWQLNLKAIGQNLQILGDPHYLNSKISHVEALFISADESIYITAQDLKVIKQTFPKARVVTVKDANHWVHNCKTEEFVDLVRDFMTARRPEALVKSLSTA